MLIEGDGGFENLENARFVVDPQAAVLVSGFAELVDFLAAPFRLDVSRRHHSDQRGDPLEAVGQRDRKIVVALKLRVPPDARLLPKELSDANLEGPVKAGHPPLAALDQPDIVEVGITDEGITFEGHVNAV